jgi:hypothetical protein
VSQDRVSRTDPASVDKRSVLAPLVMNPQAFFLKYEDAVPTADEIAIQSQLALLIATDDRFSMRN